MFVAEFDPVLLDTVAVRVWWIAMLIGCYRPTNPTCGVVCDESMVCPSGFTCAAPNARCEATPGECDVAGDAAVDAKPFVCSGTAYGAGLVQICVTTTLLASETRGASINTDTQCTFTQLFGDLDLCVIAATNVSLQGTIRVTGARPLVILGTQAISIATATLIDAASDQTMTGPGSDLPITDCATHAGTGTDHGSGAAGGRFDGVAGNGGEGGVAGAVANGSPLPFTFRPGCYGGSNAGGSLGGAPGGAIYLIAGANITINTGTVINVSGAGARRVSELQGGGGGGSGGFLGIDAPNLDLQSGIDVFVLGGGGSSGGDLAIQGAPGGESPGSNIPAAGGSGGCGGRGGNGGAVGMDPTSGAPGICNGVRGPGGGGGGGAGYFGITIHIGSNFDLALTSPTPKFMN